MKVHQYVVYAKEEHTQVKMEVVVLVVLQDIIQLKVSGNVKNVKLELIHILAILFALIAKLDIIEMKN